MQNIVKQLGSIIDNYLPGLLQLDEAGFLTRPNPEKWSKKEILGHLADSAQNNIRRFVVAQYEFAPQIIYEQNSWVTAAGYQHYSTKDLIDFWTLLNKHICVLLTNMPAGNEERVCITSSAHTIQWLAADYVQHLLHHLHQILGLEPVAYP